MYVFETLGAAAGGLAVTGCLVLRVPAQTVALISGLLLALAIIPAWRCHWLRFVPALLLSGALILGAGAQWAQYDARHSWGRLLDPESYRGSFSTAQASYAYGQRGGQFIVMSAGTIAEALPNAEHGAEVAALVLAQRPESKRVLVIGPGALSLCLQLLRLPQIESVLWSHPDPEYAETLLRVVPEAFRGDLARFATPAMDARALLTRGAEMYDIAVLNLPDVTTLALNRYATREFFGLLRKRLPPDGVAALRITAGANVLGGELASLGASALATFGSVFPRIVLKPGDETWLMGSAGDRLSEDADVLRERLAGMPGLSSIYPPDGLRSLYVPDRISFQRGRYEAALRQSGAESLLNTDEHPKALLLALIVAWRQSGLRGVSANLSAIQQILCFTAMVAFLAALLARVEYRRRFPVIAEHGAKEETGFGIGYLIFSTGLAGIGASIMILFAFQSRFGSLSLHLGLFSALFMAGSCAAGHAMERLLARDALRPERLSRRIVVLHAALMLCAAAWVYNGGGLVLALAMAIAGGLTGSYFPLAAHRLRAAGRDALASGGALESLDHVGAALGGLFTGLLLLPFLGMRWPSVIFALLLALNVPLPVKSRSTALPGVDAVDRAMMPWRLAVGLGCVLLLSSAYAARLHRAQEGQRFEETARSMLGNVAVSRHDATIKDGRAITHFTPAASPSGPCAFDATPLAPRVRGYGGRMPVAAAVRPDGTLEEVRILESRETPSYLELVRPWLRQLRGKHLGDPAAYEHLDGVTGATITSRAVLETLRQSVPVVARDVLHLRVDAALSNAPSRRADTQFLWLIGFFVAAFLLRYRPGRWRRRVFLLAVVALFGFWLNVQFSTQHIFSLLSFESLPEPWTAAFFLVLLVPALTVLAGNVYCGYLCPFGALQELAGEFRPAAIDTAPSKPAWRYARMTKYALLFLFVAVFAVTRDFGVLSADPLITFFSRGRGGAALYLALAALALSFVYPRFWCRNLCPAGAFLALLKRLRLFKRISPPTFPARCDLGVRHVDELDCIHCDRCAHAKQ